MEAARYGSLPTPPDPDTAATAAGGMPGPAWRDAGKLSPGSSPRCGRERGPADPAHAASPKGRAPRSPRTKHTRAIQEPLPASPGPTRLLGFPGTAPQPPPRSQGSRAGPRGLTRSPGATRLPRSPAAVLVRPRPGASPPPGVPVSRCSRTCTWRWKTRARRRAFQHRAIPAPAGSQGGGSAEAVGSCSSQPCAHPGAGPCRAGGGGRRMAAAPTRKKPGAVAAPCATL